MHERISVSLGKCKLKPQWIITTLSIKIFKIEKKIKKKKHWQECEATGPLYYLWCGSGKYRLHLSVKCQFFKM